MKRTPIQNALDVVLVQNKPTIQKLLPDYQYQFQNIPQSTDATAMYQSLVEFLETNEELALSYEQNSYTEGFQRAVALTRLWIDSIYLQEMNADDFRGTSKTTG